MGIYTRNQKLLTFAIGCGIAYQGIPETLKAEAYGRFAPLMTVFTVTLTGGLYALEKLMSKPHGETEI